MYLFTLDDSIQFDDSTKLDESNQFDDSIQFDMAPDGPAEASGALLAMSDGIISVRKWAII